MLQANLERQGQNISIDAAAYFDVNNYRVGVNNLNPQYTLDVTGNAHLGNLYILANTITTDPGYKLNLGNISNITIAGGSANFIVYTDGFGNLSFGEIDSFSEVRGIFANIAAANAAIITANTGMQNYVNNSNFAVTAYVTTLTNNLATGANANTAAYLTTYTGNIQAGNLIATASIYGNIAGALSGNISGYVLSGYQPYITETGNLANLTVNTSITSNSFVTNGGVVSGNLVVGNITINGNASIQNLVITNLELDQGNIQAGNVISNFYGNIVADTITPYKTPLTVFNSTTAVGLPSGTTAQRPAAPLNGYIRYNTSYNTLEIYSGGGWLPLGNEITSSNIQGDGSTTTFSLTQVGQTDGMLVSINGVVQQPYIAYSVSGNSITFTQPPANTDYVDIRYLSTIVEFGSVVEGNLSVAGVINTGVYTVSTLPPASVSGMGARAFVTDANSNTFGNSVVGAGSYKMPVWSNGSSWYIG
jgi:hypothetical protein